MKLTKLILIISFAGTLAHADSFSDPYPDTKPEAMSIAVEKCTTGKCFGPNASPMLLDDPTATLGIVRDVLDSDKTKSQSPDASH